MRVSIWWPALRDLRALAPLTFGCGLRDALQHQPERTRDAVQMNAMFYRRIALRQLGHEVEDLAVRVLQPQ